MVDVQANFKIMRDCREAIKLLDEKIGPPIAVGHHPYELNLNKQREKFAFTAAVNEVRSTFKIIKGGKPDDINSCKREAQRA